MWYFSWILGLGLALALGVLNAMWFEMTEASREPPGRRSASQRGASGR